MRPKIGYLVSSHSWGGLEMNQLRNAVWMKNRGHEVNLLCLKDSPAQQQAISSGVEGIIITQHRKYYDYPAAFRLVKLLKTNKITHLILRDTRDVSIGAIVKVLCPKIHLSYFMEMQLGVAKTNLFHTLRFRKIDLWSCPLHWLQVQVQDLTKMNISKTVVIPSGLEIAPFQTNQTQQEARELLDLPADKIILGLIGRFDPHKGQVLLLDALKLVNDPNVCVCLLGEPTRNEGTVYFDQIQRNIQENGLEKRVFIRPFREDIPTFYRAIDAFVMASKAETFGMVTIEAMASGVPTIGSNAGGTVEILQSGHIGYLFEPNNAESLSHAILRFTADPNFFSKTILQETAKNYDHEKVCEMVEAALSLNR